MGKPTGFLEIERQERTYDAPQERLKTWKEFVHPMPQADVAESRSFSRITSRSVCPRTSSMTMSSLRV